MKRGTIVGLIIVLVITSLSFAVQPEYKPGSVLVRFKNVDTQPPNTAAKNSIINAALGTTGSPVKQEFTLVQGLARIAVPADMNVANTITTLKNSSSVLYAEPDYIYHTTAIPNDPQFSILWGMTKINAPAAWDINTGSSSIIVAVTDTGVDYNHPDLKNNIWTDANGHHGYDFVNNDSDPCDDAGHGTHVAGTIGAVGNNGIGVVGVNWHTQIMALKFLDANGSGSTSNAIAAIQYAIANGAKVINASWGGYGFSQTLYDSIAAARDAGIIFVASAGNDNIDNDSMPDYPASFDLANIISVLATTSSDARASFSNYGLTTVDLGAPGESILSTYPGSQYAYFSGTSMAAPHVTGACALLLSANPALTYSQVKQILMDTTDKTLAGQCVSGGRLNLAAAIQEAVVDSTPPTPNPPQWLYGPQATGMHTVTMQADTVTDRSGVEYYFECVNDANKNSGWTANTLYTCSTLDPNHTYGFHFRARDKSASHNQTDWSTTGIVTTSDSSDKSPPFPATPVWKNPPVAVPQIGVFYMEASPGYDESTPLQYQFSYSIGSDPTTYTSSWQPGTVYQFKPTSSSNTTVYNFSFVVKDAAGNISSPSLMAAVRMLTGSMVLSVPIPYATIQSAIVAAAKGDIVEISPGTYYEHNINFQGKPITVKSSDPTNPAVVDCLGSDPIVPDGNDAQFIRRGFIFKNSETAASVLDNIVIQNGVIFGGNGSSSKPGLDAFGGGIFIGTEPGVGGSPSSPTIINCVIKNCVAIGGNGGDGSNGSASQIGPPPIAAGKGGVGGNSGVAHGGGIYVNVASNPVIQNCTINNCFTLAGNGGNGGNGGAGDVNHPGGDGGNGGTVLDFSGGGVYVEAQSNPSFVNVTISNCSTFLGNATPGTGGAGGAGSSQGKGGDNGSIAGLGNGGGIFFNMSSSSSNINVSAVNLISNTAYNSGGGASFVPVSGKTITMSDCQFSSNYAGNENGIAEVNEDGGGIYFVNKSTTPATLVLNNCRFTDNIAEKTGGGLRGGSLSEPNGSNLQIYGSSFTGNVAREGGGIYIESAVLSLTESAVSDNGALEGGGINGFNSIVGIQDSNIVDNVATSPGGMGGGVAFWNTTGNITSSTLKNNTASTFGGAVFMEGLARDVNNTVVPLQFTNCLITDNNALYEGGALSCDSSGWAKLTNCTLVGNSATSNVYGTGGAISAAEYAAWVQLENCILWDNKALNGPQISVGTIFGSVQDGGAGPYAGVYVAYSDVEGGENDIYLENPGQTYDWWDAGNLTADPLFTDVDVNTTSYYLSQVKAGQSINSPCVDAGDFNAIDLKYLAGEDLTTRTDSVEDANIVDIGYHYLAGAAKQYNLTVEVYVFDPNEGGNGRLTAQALPGSDNQFSILDTNTIQISQGTEVNLIAAPNPGFAVQYWSGTDNDISKTLTNTVTMNADKKVIVSFAPDANYYLTVTVKGNGTVTPSGRTLRGIGEIVHLTAIPTNPTDKIAWTGTDNDYSELQTNTVTMTTHKNITVEFYTPRILYVSGSNGYPTIQAAIDDANQRDIVMLMPSTQPYYTQRGFTISKNITITSVDPYNPTVVASTVIQQQYGTNLIVGPAFDFEGVSPLARLEGITIRGFNAGGFHNPVANPSTDGHYDGVPGGRNTSVSIQCTFASPTILNCVIDDCHIYGDYGGDGAAGATTHPDGGNGGWPGGAYGGALYMEYNSNPIITGCTFSNNTAVGGNGGNGGNGSAPPTTGQGGRGGGWYFGYQIPSPWEFSIPAAGDLPKDYSGLGGAVYINAGCKPVFENCSFINNHTYGGLNGICGQDGQLPNPRPEPTISYRIPNLGGAVYIKDNASAVFRNCVFTGNIADTNTSPNFEGFLGYGGAVAAEDGAAPIFIDCNIIDNVSDIGGGIYSARAYPVIEGGIFSENTAAHGGGLLATQSTVVISGSWFNSNQADISGSQGGAIALFGANAEINDCNIFANGSSGDGGGIYVSGRGIDGEFISGEDSVLIKNCLINGNNADLKGGAIAAAWYSDPNIVNCTITDNKAGQTGAGLSSSYGSSVNVINSIVWDNTTGIGSDGSQIAISVAPSSMTVRNSDIQGASDPNQFGKKFKSLDLIFCIDTTGSMGDEIAAVKTAAGQIINAIGSEFSDYRIAEVNYNDFYDDTNTAATYGSPGDRPYHDDVNFTTDVNRLIAGLQPMTAGGGNDEPEAVYSALMHCIDANALEVRLNANGNSRFIDTASPGAGAWRGGDVLRVVMLMGDAPPHDPEPYTNYTLNDIAKAATGPNSVHVMPILIGSASDAATAFTKIATATGGTVVQATEANAVVNAVLQAVGLMKHIPAPVFVDANCVINWDPCGMQWQTGSGNINADPCFISVAGYFLSQIAAGQLIDSPCVDAGNTDANSIGLANYTTRTDSIGDQGVVDMGYHYPLFTPPQYRLDFNAVIANGLLQSDLEPNSGLSYNWFTDVNLIVNKAPGVYQVLWTGTDNDDATGTTNTVLMDGPRAVTVAFVSNTCTLTAEVIGGHGTITVSPQGPVYARNTIVTLTATPDSGYRIKAWTGTDNDGSYLTTNTIKMAGDKYVTVQFQVPQIKTVPGDFMTINEAIDAARPGDIVSVASGVYHSSGIEINKEITLTSTNPDDPCVVAATRIDSSGYAGPAIVFGSGATGNTVVDGFTFTGGNWFMVDPVGTVTAGQNGLDGYGARGGAIYVDSGASPTIKNCEISNTTIRGSNATAGGNADTSVAAGRGGWPGGAYGAGVYVGGFANPTLINCTIRNCSATGGNAGNGGNSSGSDFTTSDYKDANYGGGYSNPAPGIYNNRHIPAQPWYALLNSSGLPYEGDYWFYSGIGGGVFCDKNSSATFIRCNIINNATYGGMSGVGGTRPQGIVNADPVTAYRIPSYGGGVACWDNSHVEFIDCNIKGNIAPKPDTTYHTDPYLGHGGGIVFANTSSVVLTRCNISDNISAVGGGIFWLNSDPVIRDCNISANNAYVGGGAYGKEGTPLIVDCNIYRNFAGNSPNDVDVVVGQGGGIFGESMDANIMDSRFVDNTTDASGAAVYLHGPVSSGDNTANITNCLMVNNTAGRDGGGVSANWNVAVRIANSTLNSNNATGRFGDPNGHTGLGGGLYCAYGASASIIDSILWKNDANLGPEIAIDTGFELDQHCGSVNVSYSDIRGAAGGVYVGQSGNCSGNLIWGVNTNIGADPEFVSDIIYDYHLQQASVTGQTVTSPCVDAGDNQAVYTSMGFYTTRTDGVPDRGKVDMGYHYPIEQPCRFMDIGSKILGAGRTKTMPDGVVDFTDFAILADSWLSSICSVTNSWCNGADLTGDGSVNFEDLSLMSQCWLASDTTPPEPNPSQWRIVPTGVWPSKVKMAAADSIDRLWGLTFDSTHPVQYYFQCTSGNGHDSGWQYDANYTDTGLQSYGEYAYRVRARDLAGNATDWSPVMWTEIAADKTAPTPNPMTWKVEPYAASATSVSMTATTASDDSGGIQYEFEINEPNVGVYTSGWRADPNYTLTGLNPAGPYCFRVKARDVFDNETGWSDAVCVSNLGDVTPPSPAPTIVWLTGNWNVLDSAYGYSGEFQTTTGATRWWHRVVADVTGITDNSGGLLEIRFICTNNSNFSSTNKVSSPIIISQPVTGNILGGHSASDTYQVYWNGSTIVYDVYINTGSGLGGDYTWKVCVYDPSMNSACSNSVEIAPLYIGLPR